MAVAKYWNPATSQWEVLPAVPGPQGPPGATGATGPAGPTGDPGPQGPQGVKGDKGDKGDQGNAGIPGSTGPQGTPGEKWFSGSGAPTASAPAGAIVGDWYLDTTSGYVYDKTSSTVWTFRSDITGPQGEDGIQGPQGVKGDTGPQGPQGIKGDTGLTGATGAVGAQGPQGDQGIPGTPGATGEAGPAGPQGVKGDTGSQGPQGIKGDTGDVGATGATGPAGPTGPQGPIGPSGSGVVIKGTIPGVGPPAFSGTASGDMWIDVNGNGWVWDGTTWSNVGPIRGPAGPTGPAGAQGPVGPQGPQGDVGPQGIQGVKGDTGNIGPAGPAGATGATGAAGADGAPGAQGPKGDTGATGATGSAGPTGATGPQGPTGATGPAGADSTVPGPQGPKGDTGPQGPAGSGIPGVVAPTPNTDMARDGSGRSQVVDPQDPQDIATMNYVDTADFDNYTALHEYANGRMQTVISPAPGSVIDNWYLGNSDQDEIENLQVSLSGPSTTILTGIVIVTPNARRSRRLVITTSGGSGSLTLKHENTGSIAANRLILPGAQDLKLTPGQSVTFIYNAALSRWALSHHADIARGSGWYTVQLGEGANASAIESTALGYIAQATGDGAVAVGRNAKSLNTRTVAVGDAAEAGTTYAVAVGNAAKVAAGGQAGSVAIGNNADASTASGGQPSVAAGYGAKGTGSGGVGVGYNAMATAAGAVAVGPAANAGTVDGIALGNGASSAFAGGIAIGKNASAPGINQALIVAERLDISPAASATPSVLGLDDPTGTRRTLAVTAGGGLTVDGVAVGGSTGVVAPTPNTVMGRDANGRSQVVDPAVAADISTKNWVDGVSYTYDYSTAGGTGGNAIDINPTFPALTSILYIDASVGAGSPTYIHSVNPGTGRGLRLLVIKTGSSYSRENLIIVENSASGTAAWRFYNHGKGSVDFGITGAGSATYYYDTVRSSWVYLSSSVPSFLPVVIGAAAVGPSGPNSLPARDSAGRIQAVAASGVNDVVVKSQLDAAVGAGKIGKINVVYVTATQNYTPPANLLFAKVQAQAPGGGGASTSAGTSTSTSSGSGGGGGGYAESTLTKAQITAALVGGVIPCTIGAIGSAGTGGTSGAAGGNVSFGSLVAATGGGGGGTSTASSTAIYSGTPGAGGIGTAGDLLVAGSDGTHGLRGGSSGGIGGNGGSSHLGGGGRGKRSFDDAVGDPGGQYGGGGGSTSAGGGNNTAHSGGAGAPGIVIITEYLSA